MGEKKQEFDMCVGKGRSDIDTNEQTNGRNNDENSISSDVKARKRHLHSSRVDAKKKTKITQKKRKHTIEVSTRNIRIV